MKAAKPENSDVRRKGAEFRWEKKSRRIHMGEEKPQNSDLRRKPQMSHWRKVVR